MFTSKERSSMFGILGFVGLISAGADDACLPSEGRGMCNTHANTL